MIEYITLKNFKCFENLQIRLSPLTLITGMNGMGKSTLIQSLLVIRQSYISHYLQNGTLTLNDNLVKLKNGSAVLCNKAANENIEINIEETDCEYSFEMQNVDNGKFLQKVFYKTPQYSIDDMNLAGNDFVYLNAERLSPQDSYTSKNDDELNYSRLGDIHGNKTVGVLFETIDKVSTLSIPKLKYRDAVNERIDENVSLWLGFIMGRKTTTKVEKMGEDDLKLTYTIGDVTEENVFSPLNSAFGNSYLLPIIVAVLTAKKEGIILLENPEAHLHPAAQFRLGEFLALAAQEGIQIIVETHSEHILNGVRVATKKEEITPDYITILYFKEKNGLHVSERITVTEEGDLDKWPEGFFDEWEKALNVLIN